MSPLMVGCFTRNVSGFSSSIGTITYAVLQVSISQHSWRKYFKPVKLSDIVIFFRLLLQP